MGIFSPRVGGPHRTRPCVRLHLDGSRLTHARTWTQRSSNFGSSLGTRRACGLTRVSPRPFVISIVDLTRLQPSYHKARTVFCLYGDGSKRAVRRLWGRLRTVCFSITKGPLRSWPWLGKLHHVVSMKRSFLLKLLLRANVPRPERYQDKPLLLSTVRCRPPHKRCRRARRRSRLKATI